MRTTIVLGVFVFLSSLFFIEKSAAQTPLACGKTVLFLQPGKGNPRNSEGDFVTLKNGSLLFVYSHFTASSPSDEAPAFLAGRYSYDDGKTWTDKDVVIADRQGSLNLMSVSLLRLSDGRIVLFYLKKNSEVDCIPYMKWSDDEGKTWSEQRPCITEEQGYFVLNNNRVIQLPGGKLLMPVSQHAGPSDKEARNEGKIWVYYSDDRAITWHKTNEVPNPENMLLQEPGIVSLSSDTLLLFMRSDQHRVCISRSADRGLTWTAVKKTEISSPLSPASIVNIPGTKNLMMVWNDNAKTQDRTPLALALSFNDGRTWVKEKQIENDPAGSFCYTAIHFLDSQVLLGYFDWRTKAITIKRIPMKCIYQ